MTTIFYSLCFAICVVNIVGFNIQADDANLQAIDWPFTLCGTGNWDVQHVFFGGIPQRNTNDDIDFVGTANNDINFKSVVYDVKLNGVFLHSQTLPFQKQIDSGDAVDFKYKNYIPSFAPLGQYALTFTFYNTAGKAEGCVAVGFKM